MSTEIERAKINLENLRNDLAQFTKDRDHAINLIELRKRDIANAQHQLHVVQHPVYDKVQGVARRVYAIGPRYISMRWDLGRVELFRRSDGKEMGTHRHKSRGDRLDLVRVYQLWNDYIRSKPVNPFVDQLSAAKIA